MDIPPLAEYHEELKEISKVIAAPDSRPHKLMTASRANNSTDEPIWHVLITRAGESYAIDGYRPDLRDAWNEAEGDLVKMGWLAPGGTHNVKA